MNQRQIDLALLAGIGILLVTILVLALSAAPMSARGDIDDPVAEAALEQTEGAARTEPTGEPETREAAAPSTTPEASETGTDVDEGNDAEVASREATDADTSGETAEEVVGGETAEGETTAGEITGEEATGGEATGEETTTASPTTGTQVGEGEALERVGFAFVTGSLGACGVPLEPWRHVAVSRDLLERYGCGTTVTLALDDEIAGRRQVTAQIADTMGAEVERTVNVFVAENEPALDYGVTGGTLSASAP